MIFRLRFLRQGTFGIVVLLNISGGRALGGSSVTNGLFYGRGSKHVYEKWTELGNSGWGWNDTYPLFVKVGHVRVFG